MEVRHRFNWSRQWPGLPVFFIDRTASPRSTSGCTHSYKPRFCGKCPLFPRFACSINLIYKDEYHDSRRSYRIRPGSGAIWLKNGILHPHAYWKRGSSWYEDVRPMYGQLRSLIKTREEMQVGKGWENTRQGKLLCNWIKQPVGLTPPNVCFISIHTWCIQESSAI